MLYIDTFSWLAQMLQYARTSQMENKGGNFMSKMPLEFSACTLLAFNHVLNLLSPQDLFRSINFLIMQLLIVFALI